MATPEVLMAQMGEPQITAAASQGQQSIGMLRICKGKEERFIWPVHLPGWLALGWRVAGADEGLVTADLAGLESVEAEGSAAVAGSGSRNRRRRQSGDATTPSGGDRAEPAAAGSTEPSTEALASVGALPEGLLDDALI